MSEIYYGCKNPNLPSWRDQIFVDGMTFAEFEHKMMQLRNITVFGELSEEDKKLLDSYEECFSRFWGVSKELS